MTTELVAAEEMLTADLVSLSADELRRELAKSLKLTADSLRRTATIVRLLEDKGEDLSDLRIGLLTYLRKIAYGQLLPEAVVRFADAPLVLRKVANLAIPDQRKLASGDPVSVAESDGEGGYTHRLLDPITLPPALLHQVFAKDRVREQGEQVAMLQRQPKAKPTTEIKRGTIRIAKNRDGLLLGRTFFPTTEIVDALARLHPLSDALDNDASVVLKIPEEDSRLIKVRAAENGVTLQSIVRNTLVAYGLIPRRPE